MTANTLLLLSLGYIGLLFMVAVQRERRQGDRPSSAWVYTLTLAVYCSSWTFYGAVGSMATDPWSHAPIYLGPMLVFFIGRPVVLRLIDIGHRQRVISIADFLSTRFGKRRSIAIAVSLICLIAVLPYIALQLRALALVWNVVTQEQVVMPSIDTGITLIAAAGLAVFAILFGVRRLGGNERQHGLMHAMAVESVVKLGAFTAIAVLALWYLMDAEWAGVGWRDLPASPGPDDVAHLVVSALAILCLPRQFHVTVVEFEHPKQARHIRWAVPLYLAMFMLLAVPIALAGNSLFGDAIGVTPDTYVQRLPILLDQPWLSAIAFLGGFSAATSMVLVATVSVSIMVANELIVPLLFRLTIVRTRSLLNLGSILKRARQFTVCGVLLAAWALSAAVGSGTKLTDIGFLSFLGSAQLAPALTLGLYLPQVRSGAVLLGMSLGSMLWFFLGVLPLLLPAQEGALGNLSLTFAELTALTLGVNTTISLLGVWSVGRSSDEVRQAQIFFAGASTSHQLDASLSPVRILQLQHLVQPLLSDGAVVRFWRALETSYEHRLLPADRAPSFVVDAVEAVLANTVGATSARQIIERLEQERQLTPDDFATLVGNVQRGQVFNRETLEAAVEHLGYGVSVVDRELRLIAWNSEYERMFDYPPRFLFVGCPIERVYRFNAERGILSSSGRPMEYEIERRVAYMRAGSGHQIERLMPDGRILEINGRPLPGGGFVTTYVDVTEQRELVTRLRETQSELESKLESGEEALSQRNAALRGEVRARARAEQEAREAFQSKAQFMAATSHDLLQPINAARLLSEVLRQGPDDQKLWGQLTSSLERAQNMISELREIARLDTDKLEVRRSVVRLSELFERLAGTFGEAAAIKGLQLRYRDTAGAVIADERLLMRLMENLMSNAIKYTDHGGVLMAARSDGDAMRIVVCDTGPGIREEDQARIFREFERVEIGRRDATDGLGLGLALARRYAGLLEGELELRSVPGQGTTFSISLPRADATDAKDMLPAEMVSHQRPLSGDLLCIDNDRQLLAGLAALAAGFGLRPVSAANLEQALQALRDTDAAPVALVADYRLDAGVTGIEVASALAKRLGPVPVIIISADDTDDVRDAARAAGYRFLPKPIDPSRLRTLLGALLDAAS